MDSSDSDGENGFLRLDESLVPPPKQKEISTNDVSFDGLLAPPLKVHEDLSNGCGGKIWEAGVVLAKYMLRNHRDDLKDKTILELGAGGGLVGLAVAQGCQIMKPLYITDQDAMYSLMQENIKLNGLHEKAVATILDWGSPIPDAVPNHPDVVLAADCVYFEPAFPLLLATLQTLLAGGGTCYFCFKKRRRADRHFIKSLRKQFEVDHVTDDPDREHYNRENVFLLIVKKKL